MPDATPDSIFLPVGTLLDGTYRVEGVLGKIGGFGITYLAEDTRLMARVAVKEFFPRSLARRSPNGLDVRPNTTGDQEAFDYARARFLDEARLLARFNHPAIVHVRAFFEAHGTGYLVMNFLEGRTLAAHLERAGGRMGHETVLAIARPLLDALGEIHRAGIVHRDVDPRNIYLTNRQEVVLLDFGAARHVPKDESALLSVVLKPGYAPFEQYNSKGRQGPWTDLYALAATLYRMLTGLVPQESGSRFAQDDLRPVDELVRERYGETIPPGLARAVMWGLALRPENRPQSVEAFQQALFEDAAFVAAPTDPDQTVRLTDPVHSGLTTALPREPTPFARPEPTPARLPEATPYATPEPVPDLSPGPVPEAADPEPYAEALPRARWGRRMGIGAAFGLGLLVAGTVYGLRHDWWAVDPVFDVLKSPARRQHDAALAVLPDAVAEALRGNGQWLAAPVLNDGMNTPERWRSRVVGDGCATVRVRHGQGAINLEAPTNRCGGGTRAAGNPGVPDRPVSAHAWRDLPGGDAFVMTAIAYRNGGPALEVSLDAFDDGPRRRTTGHSVLLKSRSADLSRWTAQGDGFGLRTPDFERSVRGGWPADSVRLTFVVVGAEASVFANGQSVGRIPLRRASNYEVQLTAHFGSIAGAVALDKLLVYPLRPAP